MRITTPLMLLALAACSRGEHDRLVVHVLPEHAEVFEDFLARSGHSGLELQEDDKPEKKARGRGLHVAVVDDGSCDGCFRVEGEGRRFVVHGGGVLGMQYGLTHLLEGMGFRYLHPLHPVAPDVFVTADEVPGLGVDHEPEMARRGLHLHTLHPIEGLYDFWMPSTEGGLDRAKQTVDWVVRNRGNHIQWVALDDISTSGLTRTAWQKHTREIIDYAHARGVTTGVGIQLFGTSNLQLAFDLVDNPTTPEADRASMIERLHQITDETPFDVLNLSFGEFFGEEPDTFVASANLTWDAIQEVAPGVDVPAVIHVGNYDDLRVEYQGEELLYYFLIKFADPGYKPWVHTTMYYNLFEDAGLAYLHEEFDEHRDFLLDRLKAGEPVGYFPESAYWVAFDINVPYYAPLYVRSRFTDLDRIRDFVVAEGASPLDDHVLFSSGWEWGYWQNDQTTLRMNYALDDDWRGYLDHAFEPWGGDGAALAEQVALLADLQHEALMMKRLAAYIAGREAVIDIGDAQGIWSQPDRPSFAEVAAFTGAEREAFKADVLDELAAFAAETHAVAEAVAALDVDDRYFREVLDGAEVSALRTDFAHAVFSAAWHFGADGSDNGQLAAAEQAMAAAQTVVDRRHADLHHPDERLIAQSDPNPTLYKFGYLAKGDDLCFWRRELVQVRNLIEGRTDSVPPCI